MAVPKGLNAKYQSHITLGAPGLAQVSVSVATLNERLKWNFSGIFF